jgi:hypothetical protein
MIDFVWFMVYNATFNNISCRGGQFYWRKTPESPDKRQTKIIKQQKAKTKQSKQ